MHPLQRSCAGRRDWWVESCRAPHWSELWKLNPYRAEVHPDRMLAWLDPSLRMKGWKFWGSMARWIPQPDTKLGSTPLSYTLIMKVNSWQVRIAAAFNLLGEMKKWINVAPLLWMAAQFWGRCPANTTWAMLCSPRCIIKSLKTILSSQAFPQIMLSVSRDWPSLLKSESLSLQTALS